MQLACDKCSVGVMDADRVERRWCPETGDVELVRVSGNPHLYGRCKCACHHSATVTFMTTAGSPNRLPSTVLNEVKA